MHNEYGEKISLCDDVDSQRGAIEGMLQKYDLFLL